MSQARNVTASFIAGHTLTVTKTGSGSGIVSSDVGAINCGVTCSDGYDDGTSVTLTAVASAGSRFAGWSGALLGHCDTCIVTMGQARNVTASFIAVYTFTITKTGSGSGTVTGASINCGATCSDDYDEGTSVTLDAVASAGSRFAGWSGEGCSGTGTCTVTMSQARNVSATFVALHTLTVTKTGSGAGTVSSDLGAISCGATCADDYDEGTSVTLTAAALADSRFAGWSGEGCTGTSTCTATMSQARAVTATFVGRVPLRVTVSGRGAVRSEPQGTRCRSACTRDYDAGTLVTLVASSDAGRWFVGWSGACSGRRAKCTVTMSKARFVHAGFALELALRLQIPNRLVYHQPHEWATIRALTTWRGKRLAGARVKIVVTCPGRGFTAVLRTGNRGRAALRFGATMPESLRVYTCKVRGRVAANRRTARADKPGTVSFIHPLWLNTRVANGKIVVRIWGRAREPVRLFADGKQVSRSRIGRNGWVDIVSAEIQHGDMLRVTGRNGHAFHPMV